MNMQKIIFRIGVVRWSQKLDPVIAVIPVTGNIIATETRNVIVTLRVLEKRSTIAHLEMRHLLFLNPSIKNENRIKSTTIANKLDKTVNIVKYLKPKLYSSKCDTC